MAAPIILNQGFRSYSRTSSDILPVVSKHLRLRPWICSVGWLVAVACNNTSTDQLLDDPDRIEDGTVVKAEYPAERQEEAEALKSAIEKAKTVDADTLLAQRAQVFDNELSYDPLAAAQLDRIQNSKLAMDSRELEVLAKNGFAISEGKNFPTFAAGYAEIYYADLPVFVSADSILYALHRSFSGILKDLEFATLIKEVKNLVEDMRSALDAQDLSAFSKVSREDCDLLLTVAASLLSGQQELPSFRANEAKVEALLEKIASEQGNSAMVLFGSPRKMDFSQFKPRGHYAEIPELQKYFQVMMWLGRIDLRMLEPDDSGQLRFHRRQFEGILLLDALMNESARTSWNRLEATLGGFIGEADYMTPAQVEALYQALGVSPEDANAALNLSDQHITSTILAHGFGQQRISSHIMGSGLASDTLPLSSSYAVLGQRFVVDSEVFSNVVWDRVQSRPLRMMPNPLDVAFAALNNDHAVALLESDLRSTAYAGDLNAMRALVDHHPESFWQSNIYNHWLSAIRNLSIPGPANWLESGRPEITASEAWSRRTLSTQMASWAELRHDTILYAKQSYTGGNGCEYPDAYVEPNPQFFSAIADLGQQAHTLVSTLGDTTDYPFRRISAYFARLSEIGARLSAMATHQQTGLPFDADQLAFINQAVHAEAGGSGNFMDGWYAELFYNASEAVDADPTIADVHTQPDDEHGNSVGRILHVGTGYPRLFVTTIDTCEGPRAYAGVVSTYFEQITEQFHRSTDQEWSQALREMTPDDVPWMQDLVIR